jgi:hypothetical protein
MAEVRKIVIEIGEIEKNNKQTTSTPSSSTKHKSKNLTASLKPSLYYENKEAEQQLLSIKTMAIQNTIQAIKQSVNLGMKRYFSLTEDYISENNFNNFSTAISKTTGLAAGVIAGATAGGPLGAVIGAGVWVNSEIISYRSRMSNYYSSLNATNYNTSYERTRAGLVDNGRGTEN